MLISCPECNKEISDQAPSCPGCGVPLITKTNLEIENDIDTERVFDPGKLPNPELDNILHELRRGDMPGDGTSAKDVGQNRVIVTDIKIPFDSMVILFLKFIFATVGAALIIGLFWAMFILLAGHTL